MKWKIPYKGYVIASLTSINEAGRYEAKVAIIGGIQGRSQRFLDLEEYSSELSADDRALEAAKDWIDSHPVRERLDAPRSGFAPMN